MYPGDEYMFNPFPLSIGVWSRNSFPFVTYIILFDTYLCNYRGCRWLELIFNDFRKTRCFSGKLAKWTFKLARRAFIAENLGLLAKRASSWLSERICVQATNARYVSMNLTKQEQHEHNLQILIFLTNVTRFKSLFLLVIFIWIILIWYEIRM
jgi:hypothetical protein